MNSVRGDAALPHQVFPFGNPRINACWRLPEAYRNQLRPSSSIGAKGSPACPFTLDQINFSVTFDQPTMSMYKSFLKEIENNPRSRAKKIGLKMVEVTGIEPATL